MSVVDQIICSYNEFEDVEFEYVKGDSSLNYLYDVFNPHQNITDTDEYGEIDETLNLSTGNYRILLSDTMMNMFSPESICARRILLQFLLRFYYEYHDDKNIFKHNDYPLNEFVLVAVFGDKSEIILNFHLLNVFNNFCRNTGISIELPKTEVDKSIINAIERQVLLVNRDRLIRSHTAPYHNEYLYTESYDRFVEEMCHILENRDNKLNRLGVSVTE